MDYFTQQRKDIANDHIIYKFESSKDFGVAEQHLYEQLCDQIGFDKSPEVLPLYMTGEDSVLIDNYPEIAFFRDIVYLFKMMMAPTSDMLPEIRYWTYKDAALKWSWKDKSTKESRASGEVAGKLKVDGFGGRMKILGYDKEAHDAAIDQKIQASEARKAAAAKQWKKRKPMFKRFASRFAGIGGKKSRPRAGLSGANPSELLDCDVETEEDILHVRHLPDYDGAINAQSLELLSTYLLAPYLRIPLVLSFFCGAEHIRALKNPQMQEVLDSCLFEPGDWQPDYKPRQPETIPVFDRDSLATPLGLLFNELHHSPDIIIDSVEKMLDYVLDLDTGRYNENSASLTFYVLRLAVRIEEHIFFMTRHHRWAQERQRKLAVAARSGEQCNLEFMKSKWNTHVRGLRLDTQFVGQDEGMVEMDPDNDDLDDLSVAAVNTAQGRHNYQRLEESAKRIRNLLDGTACKMLEAWLVHANKDNDMLLQSCIIHAHLAYLYKNVEKEQLTKHVVSILLSSHVFLTACYRYNADILPEKLKGAASPKASEPGEPDKAFENESEKGKSGGGGSKSPRKSTKGLTRDSTLDSTANSELQIPQTEMFDMFQSHRYKILNWMRENVEEANEVMESVVRVVTRTGTREPPRGNKVYTPRMWVELERLRGIGRFVPDTEANTGVRDRNSTGSTGEGDVTFEEVEIDPVSGKDLGKYNMDQSFEEWYRELTTQSVDTEINIQIGEFTLKKHRMQILESGWMRFLDFTLIFGDKEHSGVSGLQSAEVQHKQHRKWVRLVGRRHDLIYWDADTRNVEDFMGKGGRIFPRAINREERWALEVAQNFIEFHFPDTNFVMQDTQRNDVTRAGEVFCLMSGVVSKFKYKTAESVERAKKLREKRLKEMRKKELKRQKANNRRARNGGSPTPFVEEDTLDDISEYIEEITSEPVIKEILVFRDPPVIHVYDVIHNARRSYRSLVYTSETTFSLRCLGHGNVRDATKENRSNKASQERDTNARDRFRDPNSSAGFSNRKGANAGRLCGGGMEAGEPNRPPIEPSNIPSLAIERSLTAALGRERYLPARFLHGLVPDALLESYSFWRNKEGPFITGYPILNKLDTAQTVYLLRIVLINQGRSDVRGYSAPLCNGLLLRYALREDIEFPAMQKLGGESNGQIVFQSHIDRSKPVEVYLNPLFAQAGSELKTVSSVVRRIENLSHVLIWARAEVELVELVDNLCTIVSKWSEHESTSLDLETTTISMGGSAATDAESGEHSQQLLDLCSKLKVWKVDLPRLFLSFTMKQVGTYRALYSDNHDGLRVLTDPQQVADAEALMSDLRQSIIMENHSNDLFLMTSATAKILRPAVQNKEQIVAGVTLDRTNKEWIANLGDEPRHYNYPIHFSRAFFFTQSLASSLFMLVAAFYNRNYGLVCRLADTCVSDVELSPEEKQIYELLKAVDDDHHPDSHACRLKITIATEGSRSVMPIFWNITEQCYRYVQKVNRISAACRLTVDEELYMLSQSSTGKFDLLANRLQFLKALKKIEEGGDPGATITLKNRPVMKCPKIVNFDDIRDDSILKIDDLLEKAKEFVTAITGMSTVKPFKVRKDGSIEGGEGTDAIRAINEWMNKGISLAPKGLGLAKDALGFLFYYEVMTLAYPRPRILSNDGGFNLVCLLMRFMSPLVTRGKSVLMSILRILSANPDLAADRRLPQLVDDRKVKIGLVLKGQKMVRILIEGISNYFKEKEELGEIRWPTDELQKKDGGAGVQTDAADDNDGPDSDADENEGAEVQAGEVVRFVEPGAYELDYEVCSLAKLVQRRPHLWLLPAKADMMQSERWIFRNPQLQLSLNQLKDFSCQPLNALGLSKFVQLALAPKDDPDRTAPLVGTELPFDVSQHRQSLSQVAENMIKRFADEIAYYGNSVNTKRTNFVLDLRPRDVAVVIKNPDCQEFESALSTLENLKAALATQLEEDMHTTQKILVSCLQHCNGVELKFNGQLKMVHGRPLTNTLRFGFMLGRYAGINAKLDLEMLIKMHLTSGEFTKHVRHVNPFLSDQAAAAVEQMLVATMLHINRVGQTYRAIAATNQLLKLLGKVKAAKNPPLADEIDRSAANLVSQLTCKRHYASQIATTDANGRPDTCLRVDPRFLAFEFIHNIILRSSQIELITKFIAAADKGGSMCHQMIMGAGKTTVVGPMLALLTGDGSTLVVQVVPHSLLEMSRSVMREKFSAVIKKAVYTFKFDRFMKVDSAVIDKLRKARDTASVVCANPTAIKSFYLKFIEIMHYIDQTVVAAKMDKQLQASKSLFSRFKVSKCCPFC